jgi:hypothetical protein
MIVDTDFLPDATRYDFDFGECAYALGWAQVDTNQDASYFGFWCNPETLEIVEFAEGDLTRKKCDGPIEFGNEIDDFCAAWDGRIDPGLGETVAIKFRKLGMGHLLHTG